MTTRTTRRTVYHKHAPWISKTLQRQSNNKWRDALTWLLRCKHLIAVIFLKMFTSRQVKCGILVSCSRVEHSVDFTTAVKKVPRVNAWVDWADLSRYYAALLSATLELFALCLGFRFRDENSALARILFSAMPCYTPVPAFICHTRHAAIFTVIHWMFWPINLGPPLLMFYCIIDDCVTTSSRWLKSPKSIYPNGII